MRIFCITVVKNEADVIGQTIEHARHWSDGIFVADNGSDDGTADVVRVLSERHDNIHFLGVFDVAFTDAIRGEIFAHVPDVSRTGDWWCRLDGDEFYIDDPRQFIAALPDDVDSIWGGCYQFYFTDLDYLRYCEDPIGFEQMPVMDRLRHYQGNRAEMKFVKHTPYFHWPTDQPWPVYTLNPADRYIRFRHYQHRSRAQIEKRLGIRLGVLHRTNATVVPHVVNNPQTRELQLRIGLDPDLPMESSDFRVVIKDHRKLDYLSDDDWCAPHHTMPRITLKPDWQPLWLSLSLAQLGYHARKLARKYRDRVRAICRPSGKNRINAPPYAH